MADSSTADIRRGAERRGRRAFLWVLAVAAVAWAVTVVGATRETGDALGHLFGVADGCDGCRAAGAGAAVVRSGQRVARIRQVADPGPGRPQPLFLAPASGPVLDSLRAGLLAARLEPIAHTGTWIIAVVSPESVAGLRAAARLVLTPGEPGPPVYGEWVPRP